MAEIKWDTIEGSEIVLSGRQRVRTRGAIITGMSLIAGNVSDAEMLEKVLALAGFPAMGSPFPGTANPFYLLRTVRLAPINATQFRVILTYENNFEGIATAYTIRNSSYLYEKETEFVPGPVPGTRTQLYVPRWDDPRDSKNYVPGGVPRIRLSSQGRAIQVSALRYGDPPDENLDFVGCCNDNTWKGKPRGYWRLDRYDTQASKYQGIHTLEALVVSKNSEDWSEIEVLISTMTNKPVVIPQSRTSALDALISPPYSVDELMTPPYSIGVISTIPGALRYGGHHITNFETIMGFS